MVENLKFRFLFVMLLVVGAATLLIHPVTQGESPLTLGLDLRGGVVLRYRFEDIGDGDQAKDQLATSVQIINNRLDSTGVKEVSVRTVGEDQVEIAIPGISQDEAESYKEILQSVGSLEFVVEATAEPGIDIDQLYDEFEAELARRKEAGETTTIDSDFSNLLENVDPGGEAYFRWVPIGESYEPDYERQLRAQGKPVHDHPEFVLLRYETNEDRRFTGEQIEAVRADRDQNNNPAVGFDLKDGRPSIDFQEFTEDNLKRRMAIVLDGVVQSFPTIDSPIPGEGQITGGSTGFSQEEQRRLIAVIKSGSLPEKPVLEWQNEIGPTLGEVAIDRGIKAGALALVLILGFLIFFYLRAGLVACMALVVNGILLLGILALLNATLTLPGIAGLVLTIGMAVDANILIFERIREEAEKGKTIAQSVRNGFDRAFFTIVDANVTTFLTAFFLYRFGTASIRGFAVILMIGLATSMFSALYFSKTIFAFMLEQKLSSLKMRRILANPKIPFLQYQKIALIGSACAIAIGLVLFVMQGDKKFGMDFTGGYEARLHFKAPQTQSYVLGKVQNVYPGAEVVSVGAGTSGQPEQFQVKVKSLTANMAKASTEEAGDPSEKFIAGLLSKFAGELVEEPIPTLELAEAEQGKTRADFELRYAGTVKKADLKAQLGSFMTDVTVTGPETSDSFKATGNFNRPPNTPEAARARIAGEVRVLPAAAGEGSVRLSNPVPSNSYIGPRAGVALRDAAIRAMFFSLIGIIVYIRIRFRQYRFGLAACLALIHDVLITMGFIALVQLLNVVEVEIDLAIIAAFLTIIGYSLNDTIVIFDRIRENMPRLDQPLPEILNRSINQTLSRTILTTLTTFISVTILFFFNLGQRNVLEGFAFSLIIGVLVGTYSTIFIASPAVLKIAEMVEKKKAAARA